MKLKQKEIISKNESNKREVKIINNQFMKEKSISITIITINQKLKFSLSCNKKDKFVKIEELLYERYPEYMETENYFLINGNKINKFKTLEENGIRNNDIIVLCKYVE